MYFVCAGLLYVQVVLRTPPRNADMDCLSFNYPQYDFLTDYPLLAPSLPLTTPQTGVLCTYGPRKPLISRVSDNFYILVLVLVHCGSGYPLFFFHKQDAPLFCLVAHTKYSTMRLRGCVPFFLSTSSSSLLLLQAFKPAMAAVLLLSCYPKHYYCFRDQGKPTVRCTTSQVNAFIFLEQNESCLFSV